MRCICMACARNAKSRKSDNAAAKGSLKMGKPVFRLLLLALIALLDDERVAKGSLKTSEASFSEAKTYI